MIIRVFCARVRPGKQEEFERLVRDQSIPLVTKQKGLVAFYSARPFGSNSNEFVGISVWRDLSDIKAFAGSDWEKSVIPADELPLLETTTTHHYELFYVDDQKNRAEPSRIRNVEDKTRTSSNIPSGNPVEANSAS